MRTNSYQLTYCSNIHSGDDFFVLWEELKRTLPELKEKLCFNHPMGIGLRLSFQAVEQLEDPETLQEFNSWLSENDFYVFTANGFPYGHFQSQASKETVYLPNWSHALRFDYTLRFARLLTQLHGAPEFISLSTLPLGFRMSEEDQRLAAEYFAKLSVELGKLQIATGKRVGIALEAEPGCSLETNSEITNFIRNSVWPLMEIEHRPFIGLCVDACHAAVMFEAPAETIELIQSSEVPVMKVQVSSALRALPTSSEDTFALQTYNEPTFFHQTVKSENQDYRFFMDLDEALRDPGLGEWRIHFHVPVHRKEMPDGLLTTQDHLLEMIKAIKQSQLCTHFEIETYTFGKLAGKETMTENLLKELEWTQSQLNKVE